MSGRYADARRSVVPSGACRAVVLSVAVALCAAACGGEVERQRPDVPPGALPDGLGNLLFGDAATPRDGGASPRDGGVAVRDGDPGREVIRVECLSDRDCPPQWPLCDNDAARCVECRAPGDCGGRACTEGRCAPPAEPCAPPGGRACEGDRVVLCDSDGAVEERIECAPNVCLDGRCALCRPSETSCSEGAVVRCNAEATGVTVLETCAAECVDGRCVACRPYDGRCMDGRAERCASDGSAWVEQQDCDAYGYDCVQGACVNPCASDPKTQTNAGCDFWALDLHNAYVVDGARVLDAQNAQFAVIASNTSAERDAEVTVTFPDGTEITRTVGSRALETFLLPPTWGLDGTSRSRNGFRVQSSRPITVYQFNPLANVDVFSNDASVLLPTPSLGTEYYVATLPGTVNFRAYFTIVAVEAGTTEVTIRPTAATAAGGNVPAMIRGVDHGLTLERGDVLNIETAPGTADLAGTWIRSSRRIVVFAGHEAAGTGGRCCADHLEQQLLPVSRWGTHYVATRSMRRSFEQDHWMILSSAEGNGVRLEPAVATLPATIDPGVPVAFTSDRDFLVTADEPILLVQFLASSFEILGPYDGAACVSNAQCHPGYRCAGVCQAPACGAGVLCPAGHACTSYGACEPTGDPAMILAVPTAQFRKEYVFLTPDSYREDFANVIAPLGAVVELDGRALDATVATPVGASGYVVYRADVTDGVHVLTAGEPLGLLVYGYDDDVSYGYPGGLGLENLRE